jgi:hypothetical protein
MDFLDVFRLGAELESLYDSTVLRLKVKGKGPLLVKLKRITRDIERLDFPIATTELHDWIDRLGKYRGHKKLTEKDSAELREVIRSWRVLLEKELFDRPIIDIRANKLKAGDLVQGPKSFLKPETWKRLSRIAKTGLSDATRALSAGAFTASVMVCFRVTEDIARHYYTSKTGKKARESWNQLIIELSKMQMASLSMVGLLNYFRDRRNEPEHPDRIFSQEEAERAFVAVVDLIHEIYPEIQSR